MTRQFRTTAMKRFGFAAGLVLVWPIATTSAASADGEALDVPAAAEGKPDAARSAGMGAFLPATMSPQVANGTAIAIGLGGYDSAQGVSLFTAATEAAVTDRLALRVGATFDTGTVARRLQPNVGLRLQILKQSEGRGFDGSVAVFYRRERYSYDEGLIQGLVSLGRTAGRFAWFANVAYGQDPEGDDRDGELRLAILYRTGARLTLGLDSRLRIDLWSSDARRAARNESSREVVAGPVAMVAMGTWALVVQTGLSQVHTTETHTGGIAVAGAATVF